MLKMLISFIFCSFAIAFILTVARTLTGKQRLNLTKKLGYSILCAVLSIGVLSLIVLLF